MWVDEPLRRAPWVVVRRALFNAGLIPVGIRGESRQQRFASWLSTDAILEIVTPQALVLCRAWVTAMDPARRAAVPALAALDLVQRIMDEQGFGGVWGPAGSVGFELASRRPTATVTSDLDLVVEVDALHPARDFCSLWAALADLPVRVDVLLETAAGAVALSEYARSRKSGGSFVLRTAHGPRLTRTLGPTVGLRA